MINALAQRYAPMFGVDPSLYNRLLTAESAGNPNAISPVGAQGIAQVMPATAKQPGFGVQPLENPFDPQENARFGAEYLGAMLKRYDGDEEAALVAYNAGPGTADKWVASGKRAKLPAETQGYIKKILGGQMKMPILAGSDNAQLAMNQDRGALSRVADFMIPTAQASEQGSPETIPYDEFRAAFKSRRVSPVQDESQPISYDEFRNQFKAASSGKKPFQIEGTPQYERARNQNVLNVIETLEQPGSGEKIPADQTKGLRFSQGVFDIAGGLAQMGGKILSPLGYDSSRTDQTARTIVEAGNEIAPEGTDWMRGFGRGAAVAPAAAAAFPAGASLGSAIGSGAGGGALIGLLEPTTSDDYIGAKGLQIAGGAGFGALGGAVGYGIAKGISAGLNGIIKQATKAGRKIRSAWGEQQIANEMKRQGINLDQLSASTRTYVRDQVDDAMKAGRAITPEEIANSAAFRELGITPTKGQRSYNPMQWQTEHNLRAVKGGEPLMAQYRSALQTLGQKLDDVRVGTGGAARTPYEAGQSATGALQKFDDRINSLVDRAYQKFLDMPEGNATLDGKVLADETMKQLKGQAIDLSLPPGYQRMLAQLQEGELKLSIRDAYQHIKQINQISGGKPSAESIALGILKRKLSEAMINSADDIGGVAGKAEKYARGEAARRFKLHDMIPALKAVADDKITPDKFVERFVTSKNVSVNDLGALKKHLIKGDRATWDDLRGVALDFILKGAKKGEGEMMDLSQAALAKGVGLVKGQAPIAPEKMQILFSPKELAQLNLISRVATLIQKQPQGTVPAHSGTPQMLTDLMSGLKGAVRLGGYTGEAINIAAKAAGRRATRKTVEAAMLDQLGAAVQIPQGARNALLIPFGTAGGLAGGTSGANALAQ